MQSALDKWQATVVILAVVVAVVVLGIRGEVNGDVAVTGLIGIAGGLVGAGATAHGARQMAKATVGDPPPAATDTEP